MDKTLVNRLSIAQLTLNDAGAPETIAAAAQAGFAAVGLRVVSPVGVVAHPRMAGNETLLRAAEQSLAACGVAVLDVNSFWITPETKRDDFLSVLDAAVRLRAESILTVISDSDLARGQAMFLDCCAAAQLAGVRIALEFQPYGSVRTLSEAAALVRRAPAQSAGIVLDALHLFRSGGQPSDVAVLSPELLAFVQLCDAPLQSPPPEELRLEARHRRHYPGEGELPLFALMDALPAGITLDIETPCEGASHLPAAEQAKRAADATRRFLAAWAAHRAAKG